MIKLFKKEKSFAKKRESLWQEVNLYWKFAVMLMLLVTAASVFFGYFFFIQINKELVLDESDTIPQIKTVKKERIQKVLQHFADRKQISNQILNSPAPVVDPSL